MNQYTNEELKSDEIFYALLYPDVGEWVALKVIDKIISFSPVVHWKLNDNQYIVSDREITMEEPMSLKDKVLGHYLKNSENLTYQEIKILCFLTENSKSESAKLAGISKSRLSQILKSIRGKIKNVYNSKERSKGITSK